MEGKRWIWWLVVIIIVVATMIGGTVLLKSKREQSRIEQIRQEAIKAGAEERKGIER